MIFRVYSLSRDLVRLRIVNILHLLYGFLAQLNEFMPSSNILLCATSLARIFNYNVEEINHGIFNSLHIVPNF